LSSDFHTAWAYFGPPDLLAEADEVLHVYLGCSEKAGALKNPARSVAKRHGGLSIRRRPLNRVEMQEQRMPPMLRAVRYHRDDAEANDIGAKSTADSASRISPQLRLALSNVRDPRREFLGIACARRTRASARFRPSYSNLWYYLAKERV
jgi:hypothetical protein